MRIEAGMTALVTGASRGMGVHIVSALAGRNVNLVLAARSLEALESVATTLRKETGVRVLCVAADMADEGALVSLLDAADKEYGGIDILVNNAGMESAERFDLTEPVELRKMIEVNLLAPILLTRLALPGMIERRRGHIVNIASIAGLLPSAYEEPYNASKFGVVGFTRALRLSAQDCGWPVSASVICPGFMSGTGMFANMMAEHGVQAPKIAGTVDAAELGIAVIRSIEKDLPDLLLMPGAPRLNVALAALWPRFFEKLNSWLDLSSAFRKIAHAKL